MGISTGFRDPLGPIPPGWLGSHFPTSASPVATESRKLTISPRYWVQREITRLKYEKGTFRDWGCTTNPERRPGSDGEGGPKWGPEGDSPNYPAPSHENRTGAYQTVGSAFPLFPVGPHGDNSFGFRLVLRRSLQGYVEISAAVATGTSGLEKQTKGIFPLGCMRWRNQCCRPGLFLEHWMAAPSGNRVEDGKPVIY